MSELSGGVTTTERLLRMVILDEVNHLVERGGVKTHHNIADWIKRLSDEMRLPFVLAGIPRAQRLLNTNDQLRSRFREVVVIEPFSMETAMAAKHFCGVLKTFGGLLPYRAPVGAFSRAV